MIESYLEHAADLNARRFVLLSGLDPGEAKRKEATSALIESLQHICEAAKKYHLQVVLETFDRTVDKRALIGPSNEAAPVASAIRTDFPDFGLLYDQAHMVLLGEKPVAGMHQIKDYLVHVHVGNCVAVPGRASYDDSTRDSDFQEASMMFPNWLNSSTRYLKLDIWANHVMRTGRESDLKFGHRRAKHHAG